MTLEFLTETYNDLIILQFKAVFFPKSSLLHISHTGKKKWLKNLNLKKVSLLGDSPPVGRAHFTASSAMCKRKLNKYVN